MCSTPGLDWDKKSSLSVFGPGAPPPLRYLYFRRIQRIHSLLMRFQRAWQFLHNILYLKYLQIYIQIFYLFLSDWAHAQGTRLEGEAMLNTAPQGPWFQQRGYLGLFIIKHYYNKAVVFILALYIVIFVIYFLLFMYL